jgi:hypothetical protein
MAVLLAVASLGLTVLMWVGVKVEDPVVPAPTDASATDCSCPGDVALLWEDLEGVRAEVEELSTAVSEEQSHYLRANTTLPAVLASLRELESDFLNLTERLYSEPPLPRTVNVSHFSASCETAVLASCSLMTRTTAPRTSFRLTI